jgi:hypothetical protein
MIFVPKPESLAPAEFKKKAAAELEKIQVHYRKAPEKRKPFKFAAYKCREVKTALDRIFHQKCAYCEFVYKGGYSADVDHWRPKSSVTEGGRRLYPGYYWLAADWKNLFPACRFCNSANRHEMLDDTVESRGKLDKFPLAAPRKRAPRPGDERSERPLLLNPSEDRPEDHLFFSAEQARWGAVGARIGRNGQPSPKGLASIEIYALDRKTLFEERRKRVIKMKADLVELERSIAELRRNPKNAFAAETLRACLARFHTSWFNPSEPFLAACRQLARPALVRLVRQSPPQEFVGELRRLLRACRGLV